MTCRSISGKSILASMQFFPNYLITLTAHIVRGYEVYECDGECDVSLFIMNRENERYREDFKKKGRWDKRRGQQRRSEVHECLFIMIRESER